jgi:hypothetical protein
VPATSTAEGCTAARVERPHSARRVTNDDDVAGRGGVCGRPETVGSGLERSHGGDGAAAVVHTRARRCVRGTSDGHIGGANGAVVRAREHSAAMHLQVQQRREIKVRGATHQLKQRRRSPEGS